jgi:hypothetical protein
MFKHISKISRVKTNKYVMLGDLIIQDVFIRGQIVGVVL